MESKSDDNEVAQVKHASVEKEETTEKSNNVSDVPMAKLKKLKQFLEMELISQEDYDKNEILDTL